MGKFISQQCGEDYMEWNWKRPGSTLGPLLLPEPSRPGRSPPPASVAAPPLRKHPLPPRQVVLLVKHLQAILRECVWFVFHNEPVGQVQKSWWLRISHSGETVFSLSIFLWENLRMGVPSKKAGAPPWNRWTSRFIQRTNRLTLQEGKFF